MGLKVATASAIGLLAVLTACSDNSTGAAGSTTTTPPTTGSTSSEASSGPAAGSCPVGEWQVTTITGKSGATVNGVPVVAKSGGGFTLALASNGTWTLKGDNANVTLAAAGVSVDATVNGTAEGEYAKVGSDYQFRQQRATGKVTLKQQVAGVSSFSMDEVGPALAPGGKATLTCGPGTLQLSSESVVLDLKGTAAAGPGPADPTTTTSSGSTGGGGTGGGSPIVIADSAQTRTIDCAGRDVALNGSSNKLTFTGSCGTVSVNGSRNELNLATAGQIAVNGSFNRVTYSDGNPKTSNNGTGNTIARS